MEGRSLQIFTAVQIVAIAAILWIVFSIPGAWDLQRIIGLALMLVGIGGIVTARLQLGKSFAITAKAHQLVTHGIYSKIRNPIYVFGSGLARWICAGSAPAHALAGRCGCGHYADGARAPRSQGSRSRIWRCLPRVPPQNLVLRNLVLKNRFKNLVLNIWPEDPSSKTGAVISLE